MKLYLPQLRLQLDEPAELLHERAAEALRTTPAAIGRLEIRRQSLDARRRDRVYLNFGVEVEVNAELVPEAERRFYSRVPARALPAPTPPKPKHHSAHRPVIVGAGPAGLFCAQRLADAGVPCVLLERGKPIRRRAADTKIFRKGGPLNPESNIQFGEGGAGTYSDGKLTYRTDDPLAAYVLEKFIDYGASPEIRYLSRPHIGTEHLRAAIMRMSAALTASGVEIKFDARMDELAFRASGKEHRVTGVRMGGAELATDRVVLALGHSARDTFANLRAQGVPFLPKAFAVGVRAEHPQEMIDQGQYGRHAGDSRLPAASYAFSRKVKAQGERGVYSFCMCPGGEVMACSSEPGGVVTNGMSYSVQRSGFANSGIVVSVAPDDFGGDEKEPFAGIRFQRELEEAAFAAGGGDYWAPAQHIDDFLKRGSVGSKSLNGTYRPGMREVDLHDILPAFVLESLKLAVPAFAARIPGYASGAGILVGVETRTSSPVRIPRGDDMQAAGWRGLFPVGEGAGYAGGIVSAAVDGVRCADMILRELAAG